MSEKKRRPAVGPTAELRKEIKKSFIPMLKAKGFATDMRYSPQIYSFRKIAADAVYVCDLQWAPYHRPRFVMNFGKCPPEGNMFLEDHVPPEDVFPPHCPVHGRLGPGRPSSTAGWFRQDRPLLGRLFSWSRFYPAKDVVAHLIALFAEVEEFWRSGTVGPHMHISPPPRIAPPEHRGIVWRSRFGGSIHYNSPPPPWGRRLK